MADQDHFPTPDDTTDASNMDFPTLTFTQQLMASNEALLQRTERLLDQQEKQLKLLNARRHYFEAEAFVGARERAK